MYCIEETSKANGQASAADLGSKCLLTWRLPCHPDAVNSEAGTTYIQEKVGKRTRLASGVDKGNSFCSFLIDHWLLATTVPSQGPILRDAPTGVMIASRTPQWLGGLAIRNPSHLKQQPPPNNEPPIFFVPTVC